MGDRVRAMWEVQAHQCNHDWHGYSQPGRYGDGEGVCEVSTCIGTVTVPQGDRDCTSSIKIAANAVGIPTGGYYYTGNLRSGLEDAGWTWHPMSDARIMGDTLYYHNSGSDGHAAMSDGDGKLYEFIIAETGGIDGETGDQTGWESRVVPEYNPGWQGFMRYENNDEGDEEMSWNEEINGVQARDRLIGIDIAANASLAEGRELHDALLRTDDPTGRGTEADLYERVCWLGLRTEEMAKALEAIGEKLDALGGK